MSRFFFHLCGPSGFSRDEEGVEFETLEDAYLDLWKAAVEMSVDALRQHRDATRDRFELWDQQGQFLLDLPFSEVMKAGVVDAPPPMRDLHERLSAGVTRARALKTDLASGFEEARQSLEIAKATLKGPGR